MNAFTVFTCRGKVIDEIKGNTFYGTQCILSTYCVCTTSFSLQSQMSQLLFNSIKNSCNLAIIMWFKSKLKSSNLYH